MSAGEGDAEKRPVPGYEFLAVGRKVDLAMTIGDSVESCHTEVEAVSEAGIFVAVPRCGGLCVPVRGPLPVDVAVPDGNTAYAFSAVLQPMRLLESHVLFIAWPKSFEQRQRRSSFRMDVAVDGTIGNGAAARSVRTVDLSAAGAKIAASDGLPLPQEDTFPIALSLKGFGEVEMTARVTYRFSPELASVKFCGSDQKSEAVLLRFLNGEMMRNRRIGDM